MIDEAVLNDVRAVAAARRGCGGRKQAGITQRSLQGHPVSEGPTHCVLLQALPSFPGLSTDVPLVSASRSLQRPLSTFVPVSLQKPIPVVLKVQLIIEVHIHGKRKQKSPPQPSAEPNGSAEFWLKAKVALCQRSGIGPTVALSQKGNG